MNAAQFIHKWGQVALTERSASQQHFLDLCDLLGHEKPAEADPTGEWYTFERGAKKTGGGDGWADVWKRGFFGWEYKGKHKDLVAAYRQLLLYREDLENPPLLVVCDMDRMEVHTNFTATKHVVHTIPLQELGDPRNLDVLRKVFFEPEKLKPGTTSEEVTQEAARQLAEIAQALRGRGLDPHEVALFLDRIVFCLFAEDIGLLPSKVFSRIVENARHAPPRCARLMGELFRAMAHGGDFGAEVIRHFNGGLFREGTVFELLPREIHDIREAAKLDWSAVDPSIFGTLFERGLDPAKRSQLGAHYTSRADIETLVEPVVMQPLRREWDRVRAEVETVLASGKPKSRHQHADRLLHEFLGRLASVKVLDPACGSGNFLYVTLQKLKELEKEVIVFALDQGFSGFLPEVHPSQLYGIEINEYAFDLAQMTVWIGYLQWMHANGFSVNETPILRPMEGNFQNKDAVLDLSDPEHPREPEWPAVDFIVGNPPFLGDKLMRSQLGDGYVESLRKLFLGRVPGGADLCCYWFEKARASIAKSEQGVRAGLIGTQSIRGGANRQALDRIRETGNIFFAVSDRPWYLEGANVHVSLVGFDDGAEAGGLLDGKTVPVIYSDLSGEIDLSQARALSANQGVSFIGSCKGGPFDIPEYEALALLSSGGNPNGRPNSDIVRPVVNTEDLLASRTRRWIIDTGDLPLETASFYEGPHAIVEARVRPSRAVNRNDWLRENWWRPQRMRPAMREAVSKLDRFIVTSTTSKHRIFVWLQPPILPDHQLVVFACDHDAGFGVLHSRAHAVWSLRLGTQLRERESGFRYTPTSCFQNFPFPEPMGVQVEEVAAAAHNLDQLRTNWLNPAEWVREEVLEFPGAVDGPWARYVHEPDSRGIGTVRYPRLVPKDEDCAKLLAKRTLTNLYNERPAWLDLAHRRLDEAVFAAYGWSPGISDAEILERLLALNLERSAAA